MYRHLQNETFNSFTKVRPKFQSLFSAVLGANPYFRGFSSIFVEVCYNNLIYPLRVLSILSFCHPSNSMHALSLPKLKCLGCHVPNPVNCLGSCELTLGNGAYGYTSISRRRGMSC